MDDKLPHDFMELAKRFRRINAENPDDGRRQLDSACAIGGKLLKRATDAGYLNFQGYSWGGEQPSARDKDHAFDEQIWASNWTSLILCKAFEFPNWPSNVLSFDEQQKAGHITAAGGFRKKDWRIHAENFAYVANDLAHRIETRNAHKTVEPGNSATHSEPRHSVDFISINWFGTQYNFTPSQAACVKVLWENWENGTPAIHQATILETADSNSQNLKELFKSSPAWGNLIQSISKGVYRLAEPE